MTYGLGSGYCLSLVTSSPKEPLLPGTCFLARSLQTLFSLQQLKFPSCCHKDCSHPGPVGVIGGDLGILLPSKQLSMSFFARGLGRKNEDPCLVLVGFPHYNKISQAGYL